MSDGAGVLETMGTAEAVSAVVAAFHTDIATGRFDETTFEQAVARLSAVPVVSEQDRCDVMLGFRAMIDSMSVTPDVTATLADARATIQARIDEHTLPDSLTVRSGAVIARLIAGLAAGGSSDDLTEAAVAELGELPFTDSGRDIALGLSAMSRAVGIGTAHGWRERGFLEEPADDPLYAVVRLAAHDLDTNGFHPERLGHAAAAIDAIPADRPLKLLTLQLIVGFGLLRRPDATPALEPVLDRIVTLLTTAEPAEPGDPAVLATRDGILRGLATELAIHGFTMDAFQRAQVRLGQLGGADVVADGLARAVDIALPHAPTEFARLFVDLRAWLRSADELVDAEPLGTDELLARADELLGTLHAELAGGEFPSVAYMRAHIGLQALCLRIGPDDQAGLDGLLRVMPQLLEAITPYAPEGTEHAAAEAVDLALVLGDLVQVHTAGSAVDQAAVTGRMDEQMTRLTDAALELNPVGAAHLHQLSGLLVAVTSRLTTPTMRDLLGDDEQAELDRLSSRFDNVGGMIRYAETEGQVLRHQRGGLRRIALDLGRFERRRHLMVCYPDLPTQAVRADPNAVFFSGSDAVGELVRQGCARIRLSAPEPSGGGSGTDVRWLRLRAAGAAVLDFSMFDPTRADPPGPVSRVDRVEAEVLGAAGPLAAVAHDAGWAEVLGIPVVVIARRGAPVPFDIEPDPVLLEGDGADVDRIVAGLQLALYGRQRMSPGSSVTDTVQHLRTRLGAELDPATAELLDGLRDTHDAITVQRVLHTVVERARGVHPLLVLPFRPGGYPTPDRPALFHVSAFRDWSAVAQQEVRAACGRAGVAYGIGYARLDRDILGSVWQDLCRADFVVADITQLNPNAVLELAIAQALGRPTLILSQNRRTHDHLPVLARTRVGQYDPDRGRTELAKLLDRFLANAT